VINFFFPLTERIVQKFKVYLPNTIQYIYLILISANPDHCWSLKNCLLIRVYFKVYLLC